MAAYDVPTSAESQAIGAFKKVGDRNIYVDANEIASAVTLLQQQGLSTGDAYNAINEVLKGNIQKYQPYGTDAKNFISSYQPIAAAAPAASSGGGGGYKDPSNGIIQSSLKKITDLYSQIASYKPASFDEALAKQSVTQQTDQYYTSRIDDFLKGINLQRSQSAESEKQTLEQLTAGKERYLGGEAQQYDIAKNDALNNVVGSGRNLSGFGGRQLGQQEAVRQTGLNNFLAGTQEKQNQIQLAGQQFGQRLGLQQEQQVGGYQSGNIGSLGGEYGRQRALDIESGVANRRSEFTQEELLRQQQYNQGITAQIGGLEATLKGYGL